MFIKKRNRMNNARSDVDVQLKRRHELIPNLIQTVKWYKAFESSTLEKITTLRTSAIHQHKKENKIHTELQLDNTLKNIFAVAENYPKLKASEQFLNLQKELSQTENNIQNARRYYNATVREYNNSYQSFPSNIIAKFFNFQKGIFFEAQQQEKTNTKVNF